MFCNREAQQKRIAGYVEAHKAPPVEKRKMCSCGACETCRVREAMRRYRARLKRIEELEIDELEYIYLILNGPKPPGSAWDQVVAASI